MPELVLQLNLSVNGAVYLRAAILGFGTSSQNISSDDSPFDHVPLLPEKSNLVPEYH
jgi:hypothetical protein